jgi:hypothetical protein
MRIDQRNAGGVVTIPAGSIIYTIDRWKVYAVGAALTGQRETWGAVGQSQFVYVINGAAGNTTAQFAQYIEQANCFDMAGQTVTLSASLANSVLTSISWGLYYANAADNFGGLTQIAGGNFTGVSSSMTRFSTQIAIPAAATTGLLVTFTAAAGQPSGTFVIGDVQLELGSVATPFERRPVGVELDLCRRYLQYVGGLVGVCASGTQFSLHVNFPMRMRTAPATNTAAILLPSSLVISDDTSANYTGTGLAFDAANSSMSDTGGRVANITGSGFSGFTGGRFIGMLGTSGSIGFNAEL